MISFLQSYFLYALAAISLPFLIHFLNRRKSKRVLFSTLYFLKQLQQKKMRRLKMRQLLLLILRALIIAFIIMGFSRPTIRSRNFVLGKANVRTAAAIVLDNSMSMKYGDVQGVHYSQAISSIKEILKQLKPGDKITLFLTCPIAEYSSSQTFESTETILELLQDTKASLQYGNIMEAVSQAKKKLEKSIFPNKEIYILSDFQKSSWPLRNEQKEQNQSSEIRTFVIDVGKTTIKNFGVRNIRMEDQIIEFGKTVSIAAGVQNYGRETINDLMVHAFLGEKRVGQDNLTLEEGRSKKVAFNLLIKQSGFISGMIELADDPLLADNRGFFTFYLHDKIDLLMVGDPSDTEYLRLALAPTQQRSRFFIFSEATTLQNISDPLSKFTCVVVADPNQLSDSEMNELVRYVQSGGSLVFFPGDHMNVRDINKGLFQEMQIPSYRETRGAMGDASTYTQWGAVDLNHPIFSGIFRETVEELDSPRFYFRIVLNTESAEGTDIIKYSDGSPFLYATQVEKGSVFLFTSALDPKWSDFVYKPIFPPLLFRTMIFLASQSQQKTSYATVGDALVCNVLDRNATYIMARPDGVKEKVMPKSAGSALQIKYTNVSGSGIYSLKKDGQIFRQWAVNVDPRESDLERISFEKVKEMFGKNAFQLSSNASFMNQIEQYRFGSEVTRWFLMLALGLMILEMFIAKEDILNRIPWLNKIFKEGKQT